MRGPEVALVGRGEGANSNERNFLCATRRARRGLLELFLALASVNQLFGALLISGTAVIVAAALILFQWRDIQPYSNSRGIWFLVAAGVAIFN